MTTRMRIIFGEHIDTEQIASMLGTLEATGNVIGSDNARAYAVEIRRASNMSYLQETLLKWERHGFLKYEVR